MEDNYLSKQDNELEFLRDKSLRRFLRELWENSALHDHLIRSMMRYQVKINNAQGKEEREEYQELFECRRNIFFAYREKYIQEGVKEYAQIRFRRIAA